MAVGTGLPCIHTIEGSEGGGGRVLILEECLVDIMASGVKAYSGEGAY